MKKKIEKIKEFRYLEYVAAKYGGQETHKTDRIRRAATRMGQI